MPCGIRKYLYGQTRSTGGITHASLTLWLQKKEINDLNGGLIKKKEGQIHLEGQILILYLMMMRSSLVGGDPNEKKFN